MDYMNSIHSNHMMVQYQKFLQLQGINLPLAFGNTKDTSNEQTTCRQNIYEHKIQKHKINSNSSHL